MTLNLAQGAKTLGIPRRMTRRSRLMSAWLLIALDALAIISAALFALLLQRGLPGVHDSVAVTSHAYAIWPVLMLVWLASIALGGGYTDKNLGAGTREYNRVVAASVLAASLVGIICFLFRYDLSRGFYLLFFVVGTPMLIIERFLARRVTHQLRRHRWLTRRVILAGDPDHVRDILTVINRESWLGYYPVGALVPEGSDTTDLGLPVLGVPDDAVHVVEERDIDLVIFAEGAFRNSRGFRSLAWDLENAHAKMVVVPALTDVSAQRVQVHPVAGLPLVMVESPTAQRAGRWGKRLFDIVGASMVILMASPILIGTAIAIKLDDHGPVIFTQTRVGKGGKLFGCYKFRSMCVDAEERLKALQNEGPNSIMFKMARDPRITRVGHVIRRFSIDELPQLFNVIKGEMSLIGPRPALPKEVAQYASHVNRRLEVRPGMTGLWQVSGRSDLSWEETVRLDLYYVDNWSMAEDLSILARTVGAVLFSSGAY